MYYSKDDILAKFAESPVIEAVTDNPRMNECLRSEGQVVLVMFGDICNVPIIVKRIKQVGKIALVHMESIGGLAAHESSVRYIAQFTQTDGIISANPLLVRAAKALGILAVQQFFIADSGAYENMRSQMINSPADVLFISPALHPRVIKMIADTMDPPLIVGGLVLEKTDVSNMLGAGAAAVATSAVNVWEND